MHRHVFGLQLLQRVRERIVPDIVHQACIGYQLLAFPCFRGYTAPISQVAQRGGRQVIDTQRMIEPCVRGTRINEVREPELPLRFSPRCVLCRVI